MPFKSKSQMRYMFARNPKLAEEFAAAHKKAGKSFKTLPEKIKKKKKRKKRNRRIGPVDEVIKRGSYDT